MSKIISCNKEIKNIVYSGHTITKVYHCNKLVYTNGSTEPPLWKERFYYTDGKDYYGGANFDISANTAYSADFYSYVYSYSGGNYIYNYDYNYRGNSAITNNVSAITLNSGVTIVNNETFKDATSLVSVSGLDCCNMEYIGDAAFSGCTSLRDVPITYSVKRVYNSAFRGCTNLSQPILNEVEFIGNMAFYGCSNPSFWNLVLPSSIEWIGQAAFSGCTNLTSVYMDALTPPYIGDWVFNDCSPNLKIYVPNNAVETYKNDTNWSQYANLIYPKN